MKINLGCGTDIKEGYVNVDCAKLPGVDVVFDVEKPPLPFKDESVDEVYAKDIIEHLDYAPLMKDLLRILKPEGKVIILSPHFTSMNFWIDPTHKHAFSIRTFGFFAKENPYIAWENRKYYYDFAFSKMGKSRITFQKHLLFVSWICSFVFNLHPKIQTFYEMTMFSRLFPAENVYVELIK
jgi:SAM-dependent methyltransferase